MSNPNIDLESPQPNLTLNNLPTASQSEQICEHWAEVAQTWAEGADAAVALLGGTHSAKGWADICEDIYDNINANFVAKNQGVAQAGKVLGVGADGMVACVEGAATWGAITGTLSNQTDLNTELTNRLKTDGTNLGTTPGVGTVKAVTESYYDSTTGSWYRVWSDGFIEQGGRIVVSEPTTSTWTSGVVYPVTLLKTMANTRYHVTSNAFSVGHYGIVMIDSPSQISVGAGAVYQAAASVTVTWSVYGY